MKSNKKDNIDHLLSNLKSQYDELRQLILQLELERDVPYRIPTNMVAIGNTSFENCYSHCDFCFEAFDWGNQITHYTADGKEVCTECAEEAKRNN